MSETQAQALAYLADHNVMTLATSADDGVWAAAVFYVNDGFDLFFLSAGHTRHAGHIAVNSQVAVTIQEDYVDWPQIKGIQLAGTAHQLSGSDRKTAIARYKQKYPFIAQANALIQVALTRVNWYQIRPNRVYFIDNSQGFGHREQIL